VRELIDDGETPAELPVHFVLALASLRDPALTARAPRRRRPSAAGLLKMQR